MTDLVKNVNNNFLMRQKIKILPFSFHPPDPSFFGMFLRISIALKTMFHLSFSNEKFNTKRNRARPCFLQHWMSLYWNFVYTSHPEEPETLWLLLWELWGNICLPKFSVASSSSWNWRGALLGVIDVEKWVGWFE